MIMNNKITELMKRPYFLLTWALICGAAYLAIIAQFVFRFTNTVAGGGMILWFFFPAVICGAALLLIKGVKRLIEEENARAVITVFYFHILVIIMGIAFFAAMFV